MIFTAKKPFSVSVVRVPWYFCTMRRTTRSSTASVREGEDRGGRAGLVMRTTMKFCRRHTSTSIIRRCGCWVQMALSMALSSRLANRAYRSPGSKRSRWLPSATAFSWISRDSHSRVFSVSTTSSTSLPVLAPAS